MRLLFISFSFALGPHVGGPNERNAFGHAKCNTESQW